jgi:serine/threonine-protein kinase HipA
MKLDVHVRGLKVAQLYRQSDEYLLSYERGTSRTDFVSLTMPVQDTPWAWPRDLHPFFRQNLPEGYLLNVIREEFGRYLDGTDLTLLAVVGGSGIGRVTVTAEGLPAGVGLRPLDIQQLLKGENTAEGFASLVREYARSAISGAVPKFLAPEVADENGAPLGKSTLRTSRHIIKGSDESTPYLGFNEHFTLRVLARLEVVPVVHTTMSEDGRVIVIDRFDIDAGGTPVYGLEDFCNLLGLPPHEKYATTMERIVNVAKAYLPSGDMHAQLKRLGWLVLANYVVRNADCHSKNIALYYTSESDVAFTPVFDLVTTQAYPRYANNDPGLSIGGRKAWEPGNSLETFCKARLGIPPREYHRMVEALCDSAVTVAHEMIAVSRDQPQWHWITKQMLAAWSEGMSALRGERTSVQAAMLEQSLVAEQFSPPDPLVRAREPIGRSELLAKPRKH